MDTHKPLRCPSCQADRAFVEYGTKMGSNGKMAKWPIYAKCTNTEHCKTARKAAGIAEKEELPAYEPLPEIRSGVPTKLFQLPAIKNYDHVYYAFLGARKMCLTALRSEGQSGKLLMFMHSKDLEILADVHSKYTQRDGDNIIFLNPSNQDTSPVLITPKNIKVTIGYRYFTVETHLDQTVVNTEAPE